MMRDFKKYCKLGFIPAAFLGKITQQEWNDRTILGNQKIVTHLSSTTKA